ncbi:hypothetical protein PanWU01x14_086430 [Parasponia andersonii]|uniref:Uncharacterized protein n=1 Tax=Parasponia andersonii TaxID=3476 RepID=A0A2P5D986_PARAD|nr:hypothetical protein PanWU01x14_086430 [Parasponia andersonii]
MSPQHNKLSSSPTVLCHFYSMRTIYDPILPSPTRPDSHPGSANRSGSTWRSVYSSKKSLPPKRCRFKSGSSGFSVPIHQLGTIQKSSILTGLFSFSELRL